MSWTRIMLAGTACLTLAFAAPVAQAIVKDKVKDVLKLKPAKDPVKGNVTAKKTALGKAKIDKRKVGKKGKVKKSLAFDLEKKNKTKKKHKNN